jgi:hypothetical protein
MLSEASYHNMTVGRIPSVEGGIQPTIVDAKGDLIVATGNDSPNRLAVGANDTVLTADSAQASGVKWASLPSSFPASATATVATTQTTTSATFTNLTTSGPAVTVTTGTKALVIVTARLAPDTLNALCYMDFDVSGATTRSASTTTALGSEAQGQGYAAQKYAVRIRASAANLVTLTAGSNTFTAKYSTSTGTAEFQDRTIFVMNLA